MPELGQLKASTSQIAATTTTTPTTNQNTRLRTSISFTLLTSLAYTALTKLQNIMNKQPSPNNSPQNVEARLRTIRTLWFALVMSVVMYYVFTLFKRPDESVAPNNTVSLALLAISVSMVLVSFFIKSKLLSRAIDQQQGPTVQQAYIVALAICEVPALLGMLDHLLTANRYYYVPMIIAIAGQLLHFPRREHVENASFKRSTF